MGEPLASIIIPVYNVEAYLEECVQSVCAQTYTEIEVILVDDGSTDGSGRLCDYLAQKDARVRVLHQENSGVSAARNAGLDAAKGIYIYFVDGDDWVEPTMVEESVGFMEQGGYDLCSWGHSIINEDGEVCYFGRRKEMFFSFPTQEKKWRFLCHWILTCRLNWSVWSRVFRRDIIEQSGLRFAAEQKVFEDLDFIVQYLIVSQNLYYTPKPFYNYRQRDKSALHTITVQKWALNTLRMVCRQDGILSKVFPHQPRYAYSGIALVVLMDHFVRDQSVEQGLAGAVACYKTSRDWPYLQKQAFLAAQDQAGVRRSCGWRLGGLVNGFYHYLLTGDASVYLRADQMQRCFVVLRGWKNKLLHGRRRKE